MGTRATTTTSGTRSVHRLKVTLSGSSPPVWRRLAVPSATTLGQLHHILQRAMGWEDCHLHEFEAAGSRYGPPGDFLDNGWSTPPKDEETAKLSRVAPAGTRLTYEYDFGDGWHHRIVVEKVEKVAAGGPGADGPTCLSGRRACPPEDCGGVWGYEHLLEVLADPAHVEYEELLEWAGEDFDPERFDLDHVNAGLGRARGALAGASWR
ncbi:MAG: plasmid pRiA4b ORF-3 family protein [Acidimicrobiales bacterium]